MSISRQTHAYGLLALYYHTHLLGSNIFVAILIRLFYFIAVLSVKRSKLGFSHTIIGLINTLSSVDHAHTSRCFLCILLCLTIATICVSDELKKC